MPHTGGYPACGLDALVGLFYGVAARPCVAVSPSRGSWGGPPAVREGPEVIEASLKIRTQPEWVELLILSGERGAACWAEDAAGEHPAVGRLRAIVACDYAGAVAFFGHQFAEGLKEVHVQP